MGCLSFVHQPLILSALPLRWWARCAPEPPLISYTPPPLQVVGKVRSGTGFALLGKLQPYNPVAMAAAAALDLPAQRLFGLMYAASAQIEGAAGR